MRFKHVRIESIAYVKPPSPFTSNDVEDALAPVYEKLRLPQGRLELMTGIEARHYWDHDIRPSEASAIAGEKVLEKTRFDRDDFDLLIHCAVSRDCLEPATAAFTHGLLKLSGKTQIFDISNACLGFANAMHIAAGMIESGQMDKIILVSGENGKPLLNKTLKTLLENEHTRKSIKPYFANLTIGAGAAAAVLCHEKWAPDAPKLLHVVTETDTSHNELCQGDSSSGGGLEMLTDSEELLKAGLVVAQKAWNKFEKETGWNQNTPDHFVCHQVGRTHQRKLFEVLGLDHDKDHITYDFLGNVGSVSLPATLAHANEKGAFKAGDKIAMLGIGSGLSSMMLAVEWQSSEEANLKTETTSIVEAKNDLPEQLKEEYPFNSNFLKTDAGNMHYLDEGEGEAVLMLHGNPTWSFMYRNVVKELKAKFRCIVPDHIGMGLSDKPQSYSYQLNDHIEHVLQLVDSLKINKLNLIVHDWGGAIGMGLATRRPDLIKQIVVLNTGAWPEDFIPKRINLCRIPGFGALAIRGFNAFAAGAVKMAVTNRLSEKVAQGFIYPYNNWKNRISTLRFVQDIPLRESHPSYDCLAEIGKKLELLKEKPMLICWGGKDWCFNDRFYKSWVKRFPKAMCNYTPKAGHYILEDAKESVIPQIANFLNIES